MLRLLFRKNTLIKRFRGKEKQEKANSSGPVWAVLQFSAGKEIVFVELGGKK